MTPTTLTPREIVSELDRYIVGQRNAKRAVAIALRNRWRRQQVRRRAARRDRAEEHHHDRPHRRRQDRDRAPPGEAGAGAVHQGRGLQVHRGRLRRPRRRVDDPRPRRAGHQHGARTRSRRRSRSARARARRGARARPAAAAARRRRRRARARPRCRDRSARSRRARTREKLRRMLREGKLDDRIVEIEVTAARRRRWSRCSRRRAWRRWSINLKDMFANLMPKKTKQRSMKRSRGAGDADAGGGRASWSTWTASTSEAIRRVEQSRHRLHRRDRQDRRPRGQRSGPDVSREGVQRDLLPIVEGSHGQHQVRHGAHRPHPVHRRRAPSTCRKPSDLIPELQGRFPIRVELEPLDAGRLRAHPHRAARTR